MQKHLLTLGVVLMAALVTAGVGGWGPLALAAAKKVKPVAPVPQTGQTTLYATGDDGDLQAGVAWPVPRFTDNGNGTVTDTLTGLIWLKQANCSTISPADWLTALAHANGLAHGQCGLMDGSHPGDWRIPSIKELQSLVDLGQFSPAVPSGHPFSGVQPENCWSSTTYAGFPENAAWNVYLLSGYTAGITKSSISLVWPVREGD
jgi:Protein of unknown function (DUF1566)